MSDNEEESHLAETATLATTAVSSSRGRLLKYVTVLAVIALIALFGDSVDLWTEEKQIAESPSKVAKDASSSSSSSSYIKYHQEDNIALHPPAPDGLWIHVQDWAEGISHWTYSFSQLLAFAKKFNATLVEPGIENGRLVVEGNLRFSDVYNQSLLEDYHAKFATLQQFQEVARDEAPVFDLCLQACNPHKDECSGHHACSNGIPSSFKHTYSETLERAIASSQNSRTVLNIHSYWVDSLHEMYLRQNGTNTTTKLVEETQAKRVADHHLHFVDELYDMAEASLEGMGIAGDYAVIHWRAERENINYMECAHGIVRTKDAMGLPPNTSFVLISSLMQDSTMEWGGAAHLAENTSAPQALDFLINDHSFRKVGSVVNTTEAKDLVVYSVLDLIISQKATAFATCTRTCRKPHFFCRHCNYLGQFAVLAMDMRGDSNKDSLECWPQSVGEDFVYYNHSA